MKYKTLLIVIFILCNYDVLFSKVITSIEYRNDAFENEENKNQFYRYKLVYDNNINYCFLSLINDDRTWGYKIDNSDIALYVGNFYIHNGFGLLFGKQGTYIVDPLSICSLSKANKINFAKSGKSYLPLNGSAIEINHFYKNSNVNIILGASAKNCYIDIDSSIDNHYQYSLDSIIKHNYRDKKYNQLINIYNVFTVLSFNYDNIIKTDILVYKNYIKNNNNDLLFDKSIEYDNEIYKCDFGGVGFYYTIDLDDIFVGAEYAISIEENIINDVDKEYNYSKAYILNFKNKSKFINFNFLYIKTDDNYYAPYGYFFGGNNNQETFKADLILKFKGVKIGSTYIDQNYLNTSSYYNMNPHKQIVSSSIELRNRLFDTVLNFKKGSLYKDNQKITFNQIGNKLNVFIYKNLCLTGDNKIKKYDNGKGYLAKLGLKINYKSLRLDLSGVYYNCDVTMYTILSPLPETSMNMYRLEGKDYGFAFKMSYKGFVDIFIRYNYFNRYNERNSFEFYLKKVFI